jgi:hypothetical protein
MLGLSPNYPATTSSSVYGSGPYVLAKNEFGDEVLVDSRGRIIAGDPGQLSIDNFLQKAVASAASSGSLYSTSSPNYATLAVLAVVAFIALGGRR